MRRGTSKSTDGIGGNLLGCHWRLASETHETPARCPWHTLLIPVTLYLAALVGCAGYQVGNQSLYPGHIKTVYVPVFESTSFRRNLGERLTEAVAKEIEARTPYKVTGNPGADSVLLGRLVGESKRVVVGSRSGDPTELQVNVNVEISWQDRRGNTLRQFEPIALPPEIVDVGGAGNLVPAVGQSVATSQQKAIERVAQQIVGLMENPW